MNLAIVEDLTSLDVQTMNRVKQHGDVQKVSSLNGLIHALLTTMVVVYA